MSRRPIQSGGLPCRVAAVGFVLLIVAANASAADEQPANGDGRFSFPAEWRAPLGEAPRTTIRIEDSFGDLVISGDGRWVVSSRIEDVVEVNRLIGFYSFEAVVAVALLAVV